MYWVCHNKWSLEEQENRPPLPPLRSENAIENGVHETK